MTKTFWMALGAGLVTLGAGAVGWSLTHQPPPAEQIVHGVALPTPSYDTPASSAAPAATETAASQTAPTVTPAKSGNPVSPSTAAAESVHSAAATASHSTRTAAPKTPQPVTTHTAAGPATATASPPAQKYPSLAAQTAQEPIASLSAIQAALAQANPRRLGTLRWNAADAQAIVHIWGSRTADRTLYAETFVVALLSDNASVFDNGVVMPGAQSPGFVSPLQIQGSPTDVSQIDQLQMGNANPVAPWAQEVPYTVTYTTTGGQVAVGHGYVALTRNPAHPAQWLLSTTGMLPGQ